MSQITFRANLYDRHLSEISYCQMFVIVNLRRGTCQRHLYMSQTTFRANLYDRDYSDVRCLFFLENLKIEDFQNQPEYDG